MSFWSNSAKAVILLALFKTIEKISQNSTGLKDARFFEYINFLGFSEDTQTNLFLYVVITKEAGGGIFSICPPFVYKLAFAIKFASLIPPASANETESVAVLLATLPILNGNLPVSVVR